MHYQDIPVWFDSDRLDEIKDIDINLNNAINNFIVKHQLPSTYRDQVRGIIIPLAMWITDQFTAGKPIISGINGAQGSGKSTLVELLVLILTNTYGLNVAALSLDDLYLTSEKRRQLARDIHPLLETRGAPGTHDIALGIDLLQSVKKNSAGILHLPVFDKSIDDRIPIDSWKKVNLPLDILLFEGWCVGARPQTDIELSEPVNSLEAEEDIEGVWRQFVNKKLAGEYQVLFNLIDHLIMLKVPSMQQVIEWRSLQERQRPEGMSDLQLQRFIAHYQ